MHERRRVFERLHEIGLERVLQQSRHGALGLELAGANGLAVVGVADHDLPEALLEVGDGGRQAQDRHDLRRDGDVESILAWDALGLAADAVDDMAELTVVHVDDALPSDALGVDAERVALLDVVIQHGSEQVVGSTDGMEVAGEMKVDILHGDDLGVSAAGGTALDTEDRAERGLAQRDSALDAAATQSVGQTDGRRGLALARGRWVDGSDEDELGLVVARLVEQRVIHLGLVEAIGNQVFGVHAGGLGHLLDRPRLDGVGDFDISRHGGSLLFSHVTRSE